MDAPRLRTDPQPVAELRAVSVRYANGVEALSGIDLSLEPGETLVLIGGSGSGKTTLLRLLNRMLEPAAGEVRRRGHPLSELEPIELRRRTGYVHQQGGLLPHWTVARNVALVPELLGWPRRVREAKVRELLDAVGLESESFAGKYPHTLSGGQRQRVAFARALAADPELLLLDEPFAALDAINRRALHEQFLELKRRFGASTVLVTHDLAEAFRLGNRIAVLQAGRLLQVGRPQELQAAPAEPYVEELLQHLEVAPPAAAAADPI